MNQVIDRLLRILIPTSGKYNCTAKIISFWWLSRKEHMGFSMNSTTSSKSMNYIGMVIVTWDTLTKSHLRLKLMTPFFVSSETACTS